LAQKGWIRLDCKGATAAPAGSAESSAIGSPRASQNLFSDAARAWMNMEMILMKKSNRQAQIMPPTGGPALNHRSACRKYHQAF